MQQDTLDDTYLLGFLGHLNDAAVRVATIMTLSQCCPPLVGIIFHFLFIQILVEHLDGTATHGNGNDTNLLISQFSHHRTTEIVGRTKLAIRTDNRTFGLIPIAQSTFGTGIVEITGSQHLEPLVNVTHILGLPLGIALHVRLSEADVDIEIGINICVSLREAGRQAQEHHK